MAYKFQLGGAILSGALNVKGDLTASTDVSGALANISASNFLVGGGLQLQRITASVGFYTTGSDGILWLNARDGKVVAITPENLAVGLAGDGLLATTGSVVVNIDDSTINIAEDKIQVKDLGIGTGQLGTGSVTRAKIGQDAVGPAQINIFDDGLAPNNTQFLIADGTDFSSFALSGDVTCTNAGVVTIEDDAVETDMIADAAVTKAKIVKGGVNEQNMATGSLNTNAYATGSIRTPHLRQASVTMAAMATGSVETAAFATGSVTRVKIASNAVGSEQLVTGSVLRTKIAASAVGSEQLVAGCVLNAKIADAAVDEDKLSADVAGQGLDGGAGSALSIDLDSITTVLTGSSLDGLDVFGVFEISAGAQKKSTLADIATKMAGSGITATNGVLAVGAVTGSGDSITATAVADGDDLVAGINYFDNPKHNDIKSSPSLSFKI